MPAIATPAVIFLLEDEVREAARYLERLRALRRNQESDEAAIGQALVDAINVCMTALAGAERDDVCVLLTSKPKLGMAPATFEVAGLGRTGATMTDKATPQGLALTEGLGPTPGPWHAATADEWRTASGEHAQWGRFDISAGRTAPEAETYYRIASVSNVNNSPQNQANAKLIAAAPKLGNALRDLVDVMTGRMDGETVALHNALEALRDAGLVA